MKSFAAVGMLVLAILVRTNFSCLPPSNIEGVAFTSGEKISIDVLASLGKEGINYLAEGEDTVTSVRYRSHYDERAMVYVGTYGLSYQEGTEMPCMGVILDPELFNDLHKPLQKEVFDFSEAVRTELQWLVANDIIALSEGLISRIDSALQESTNGGVQYWTAQKNALGYNSWYNYDSLKGVWSSDGVNAVRTVKSTQCAVINPEFSSFTTSIEGITSVFSVRAHNLSLMDIQAAVAPNGDILLKISRPFSINTKAFILSLNGQVLRQFIIPANTGTFKLSRSKMQRPAAPFVLYLGNTTKIVRLYCGS